jgi:hypothetical protein
MATVVKPPELLPPLRHETARARALSAERRSGGEVGTGFFTSLL